MIKIRLTFAFAACITAALTTFVTVAPQPANASALVCADQALEPVLA